MKWTPDPLERIRELEACAYAAWPAAQVEERDGWRARYTAPGFTRRANSVWVGAAHGDVSIDDRLAWVERFYDRHGADPLIQMTPLDEPAGLDAALADRGWSREAAVSIQTAAPAAVAAASATPPSVAVEVSDRAPQALLDLALQRSRFAAAPGFYRELLGRIGHDAGFVLARRDGVAVAMALGIGRGRWLGIFTMFTVPEARDIGVGRALLGGLAHLARERSATGLYLQVERDNPPALALYRRTGFQETYGYHYRRR